MGSVVAPIDFPEGRAVLLYRAAYHGSCSGRKAVPQPEGCPPAIRLELIKGIVKLFTLVGRTGSCGGGLKLDRRRT